MDDKIVNLEKDLCEWKRMKWLTCRAEIAEAINDKIESTQRIIDGLKPHKQLAKTSELQPQPVTIFAPIDKFAWEQTTEFVKIYVTVPDVGSLDSSAVTVNFEEKFVDLKVNIPGKAKRCRIHLKHEIDGSQSKFRIKKDMVSITLKKKPSPASSLKDPTASKATDPGASLMEMMKNMYDQGDDDMKRTIAKAWVGDSKIVLFLIDAE